MISLCIKDNNINVINNLFDNVSNINMDNIIFSKKTFSKYENIILHYTGNNQAEFYNEITNSICSCILKIYEPIIVKEILSSNYFYFEQIDINQILKNCFEILNLEITSYKDNTCDLSLKPKHFNFSYNDITFSDRKSVLWTDILKYITSTKTIFLDGFIRFRIKNYLSYLDDVVDTSVNQYIVDKEYFNFVELVKLYIESKSPQTDFVNLLYSNGESILMDNNNNIIDNKIESINNNYLSDISFSSNDYTLNILLSLLPEVIKIHLETPADEFIDTLKLIFGDRVKIE